MGGRGNARGDVERRALRDAEHWTQAHAADCGRDAADARAHEVARAAAVLERTGRLSLTRGFIQHGDVTVYAHVLSVAQASLAVADALARTGVHVDRASLLRGALLHDYFLYDWHDPDPSHRLHGFRHPFFALERAEEDFDLTPRERNIIVRHMFPLVPIPPTCREAWIVCLADKWCALRETVAGRLPGRNAKGAAASVESLTAGASDSVAATAAVPGDGSAMCSSADGLAAGITVSDEADASAADDFASGAGEVEFPAPAGNNEGRQGKGKHRGRRG